MLQSPSHYIIKIIRIQPCNYFCWLSFYCNTLSGHSGRPATATSPTSVSTVTDITSILEELSSDASAPDQFQAVLADSFSSEPEAKFTECRQQSRPFSRPVCSAKDEEIELTNHAVPDHRVCARSENTDILQTQEASGWTASERFLQNKVNLLENKLQQYKCDSSESPHCTGQFSCQKTAAEFCLRVGWVYIYIYII